MLITSLSHYSNAHVTPSSLALCTLICYIPLTTEDRTLQAILS